MRDWVDELVAEVVDELDPVSVWMLGSVARGDEGPDSDIDLLVVLRSFSPTDVLALKRHVHERTTVPVPFDIAFTDPDRFLRRSKVAGTLERAAVREGRCVYDRG